MQATLLGIKELDFKPKDGDQIKGTQLFVSFPEKEMKGVMTDKYFFRSDSETQLPKDLKVGDILDVTFNRNGKVETIAKSDGKKLPPLGN